MIKTITTKISNYLVLQQLLRFCLVGTLAATVNMFIVVFLVEFSGWHPLTANIIAFLLAFQVSYFGHRYWSFDSINTNKQSLPRFFIVACSSFALNEGLYSIFLTMLHLHYIVALILVLIIVPIFTFTLSKLWAFQ